MQSITVYPDREYEYLQFTIRQCGVDKLAKRVEILNNIMKATIFANNEKNIYFPNEKIGVECGRLGMVGDL